MWSAITVDMQGSYLQFIQVHTHLCTYPHYPCVSVSADCCMPHLYSISVESTLLLDVCIVPMFLNSRHCFLNHAASHCIIVLAADSRDSTSSLGCSESVTKCTLSGLRGHTEHRRANRVFVVWFSLSFCLSQIKFS